MIHRHKIPHELPGDEKRYIFETASIIANECKHNLLGIYLFGSVSYNEYIAGESDLDIQVVVKSDMNDKMLETVAHKLLHRSHPCPATKLELTVYTYEALLSEKSIAYSLNLNTGRAISDHISFNSKEDSPHWFLLDIAIGRTNAISLYGAKPCDVFPVISNSTVAQAMLECLEWFAINQPSAEAHMLCICRCYAFIKNGALVSKKQGKALVEKKYGFKYVRNEADMLSLQEKVIKRLQSYAA